MRKKRYLPEKKHKELEEMGGPVNQEFLFLHMLYAPTTYNSLHQFSLHSWILLQLKTN